MWLQMRLQMWLQMHVQMWLQSNEYPIGSS